MSAPTMRKQFLDVFLKEWELRGGTEGATRGHERDQGNDDSDAPLNAGELRLFAQGDNDLVGLLYKRLDDGWIIVPITDFTVPATEQEILIGKRVYQLWNSFTASDEFAGQSWLVDTIPESDMKDLCEALLHVMVGDPIRADLTECMGLPITSVEDPRLEYERIFAMGGCPVSDDVANDISDTVFCNVLDQLFDKYLRTENDYALAAATDDLNPTVPILMYKGAWDAMMEGREVSGFSGYSSLSDAPTGLTFYLCGDIPEEFGGKNELSVSAYKRETRELVGKGYLKRLADGRCRISIRLGEGCEPVDVQETSELVLVAE